MKEERKGFVSKSKDSLMVSLGFIEYLIFVNKSMKSSQHLLKLDVCIFVKLREREGQRVDLGRSLKGHL